MAGSVTAILYWLSNPIWIGGTLAASTIAALDGLVLHKPLGTAAEIIVGLAFVWVTVAIAIVAFRIGKWGPNIGTFVKIAVAVLFTVLFIAFLVQHGRPAGASAAADLKPSLNGFLTVVGLMVFLWVGFELANGAAEEMRNPQRDVPEDDPAVRRDLRRGVRTADHRDHPGDPEVGVVQNVGGFVDAYSAVSGVTHSHGLNVLFAILLIVTLLASGAVWLEGADRTQAIASLDGAGPKWMGRFTGFGTPIAVNISSGVVSSAFVLVVFLVTSGKLANFFAVMLSLTVSTTAVSYFFILPALVRLRKLYPETTGPTGYPAAWRAPGLRRSSPRLFVVITAVTLLWPERSTRLFGQSYSVEASWGVSRAFFEWVTLGAFGVMVLLGMAFWAIGARNDRRGLLAPAQVQQDSP